jgi:hypothetical protein
MSEFTQKDAESEYYWYIAHESDEKDVLVAFLLDMYYDGPIEEWSECKAEIEYILSLPCEEDKVRYLARSFNYDPDSNSRINDDLIDYVATRDAAEIRRLVENGEPLSTSAADFGYTPKEAQELLDHAANNHHILVGWWKD